MPVRNSVIWQNSVIPFLGKTVRVSVRVGMIWAIRGSSHRGFRMQSPFTRRAGGEDAKKARLNQPGFLGKHWNKRSHQSKVPGEPHAVTVRITTVRAGLSVSYGINVIVLNLEVRIEEPIEPQRAVVQNSAVHTLIHQIQM